MIEATREARVHDNNAQGHPAPSIAYFLTHCPTRQYAADGKTTEFYG